MVGIDISDRSIKIAEISSLQQHKLRTVGWSALPPNALRRGIVQNANQVVIALQDALAKCSPVPVADTIATLSIPETQSFVRLVELPQMSERETNEAVQWAIRQHIPFDLERVYLDWQPIQTATAAAHRQYVLVGAAQRDVIDPLLSVIDQTGLQVVALELEAQALIRSLLPLDASDVSGVLLIDLGATSTNIVFYDRGLMRFTTSLQRGGDDLTAAIAQELQLAPAIVAERKALIGTTTSTDDPAFATAARKATVVLIKQISRVVDEISAQVGVAQGTKAILLAGGAANLPGIVDVFAEVFPGIPIEMGNPLINVTNPEKKHVATLSPIDALHFTTAIGLALRTNEYA